MISKLCGNAGFLTANVEESSLTNRIFGLDAQLLVDTAILALSVFTLFIFLSYMLFNPARELLRKRREKIQEEMEKSAQDKLDAMQFKDEYENKLKEASNEVDEILSEGRKKALKRENDIINEAKVEANKILERANREIELEKGKLQDEVKQEMITIASVMAGKLLSKSIDEEKQAQFIDEALNEMGDKTWQS